jgi:CRISPR/Cas system CSM-associated protein Csm3 (group 7 of RAMP superfamily)
LRGVLRSHAEAIARTIVNLDVNSEQEFLARCPAADPLAMRVNDEDIVYLESLRSRLRHSSDKTKRKMEKTPSEVERYFDCADQLFGNTYHGSRLMVEDAYLADDSPVIWKPLEFVAIDRFTGGSADQKKFDAMTLWQPTFNTRLILEAPEAWEIGWLLMVLRDLSDGLITIGSGASKGCGHVGAANMKFKFGWSHPEALSAIHAHLNVQDQSSIWTISNQYSLVDLPIPVIEDCLGKWSKFLDRFGFRVHQAVQHQAGSDPYWGKYHQNYRIEQLYQREISLNEH